jgi:hypothetical protein
MPGVTGGEQRPGVAEMVVGKGADLEPCHGT